MVLNETELKFVKTNAFLENQPVAIKKKKHNNCCYDYIIELLIPFRLNNFI